MGGTLSKAWWLLAVCGIADALHGAINLLITNPSLVLPKFALTTLVWDMGVLALAAGACAIAAGLWSAGKDHSWLLSLHGLALGAFGAIAVSPLVKGTLGFRPVSLSFTVMAASLGAFALETAQTQRRGSRGRWFLVAAGAASISFAFSFIAVGFFFRLEPPQLFFIWMSSYFVFCAVFMLWLAFHVHSRATGIRPDGTIATPAKPAPRTLNGGLEPRRITTIGIRGRSRKTPFLENGPVGNKNPPVITDICGPASPSALVL